MEFICKMDKVSILENNKNKKGGINMNYESIKLVNENNKRVQQMKEQKKLKNRIKKLFKK